MTKEEIQELYKKYVLPASREPANYSDEPLTEDIILAYNPMCGDKYKLKIDCSDGMVKQVKFSGHGCALSKASTSAMIRKIEGSTISQAKELINEFIVHFENRDEPVNTKPSDLLGTLIALRDFGGRRDCITLCWKALQATNEQWND